MSVPEKDSGPSERGVFSYSGTEELLRIEAAMTNYNAWIIDMVIKGYGRAVNAQTNILDFGAGLGTLSQIFYDKSGVRPDAIEVDPQQRLETARRGFKTYANIAELPMAYDLIFVSNVLEHIEKDVDTLAALRGYLKKDGILVIYVPAFEALWTAMDDKVEHIRRYRKLELAAKLKQAGYNLQCIRYCDSLGFFITLLFKYIGSKEGDLPIKSLYIYDRFLLPISRTMDIFFSHFFGKNLFVVARS